MTDRLSSSANEENHLVLITDPQHQQIVSQEDFNVLPLEKKTRYLSRADKAVEKEIQAMMQGLFHQSYHKEPSKREAGKKNTGSLFFAAENTSKLNTGSLFSSLSKTPDFLPGVEIGSQTHLNTKEFLHYSFFSRMKEQLYWRWTQYFKKEKPFLLQNMRQESRGIFSTYLYVFLSPDGEMQDLQVANSSGSEFADSAALHAFLASAPFPNPPPGLVEEDGFIHIQQSFHLYIAPPIH